MPHNRSVFYISDGTGISAQTMGHSLLTQFENMQFRHVTLAFIDSLEKADQCVQQINNAGTTDGVRPLVMSTLVNPETASRINQANARHLDFFKNFITPLEEELGQRSTHTVGRTHGQKNTAEYKNRIEALNFTLSHDDGIKGESLERAEIILVGVSRSGKTPTSLYLALHYGIYAANYPLIPEDFDRNTLPEALHPHRHKLVGLTINAERLSNIRNERRPDSRYASIENCQKEQLAAERLMRRENIPWLDSSTKSIEELAASIVQNHQLTIRCY